MLKPKLIAAVHPFDAEKAKAAGFTTMAVGWETSNGRLYRPSASAVCDILCCRLHDGYRPEYGAALSQECRRLGAGGIFFDLDGGPPEGLDASHFGKIPLSFFSTAELPFAHSVHSVAFGESWLSDVPQGAAVFLTRTCRQTRIPRIGTPVSRTLSQESLEECIARFKPNVCRSKALCADYFYAADGDETVFTVFDSRDSLQSKLSLLSSKGVEYCFFKYGELGELLT